jgi:hypothetical protein
MTYDLTNKEGRHWKISNSGWYRILETAQEYGWNPAGTVMYKWSGLHPDQEYLEFDDGFRVVVSETKGDVALSFEQSTKSKEIESGWSGDYTGNSGQVITLPDAAALVDALTLSLEAGAWIEDDPDEHTISQQLGIEDPEFLAEILEVLTKRSWVDALQDLITILEEGEVRIT